MIIHFCKRTYAAGSRLSGNGISNKKAGNLPAHAIMLILRVLRNL